VFLMFAACTRLAFAAIAVLLSAGTAAAQLLPGWENKSFTLERVDADRLRLKGTVEINGVGANAGQQIFADELEWNMTTGEFTASGNVLLVSPTARLAAERVTFNTKTGLGTFHNASGLASLGARASDQRGMFGGLEPEVIFYGETIEKIAEDKYRITDGGFTTCVQPTPRWDIVTGTATIDLDDYAILRNAVVRVKDVPVFYLPVLYYPIGSDDRSTGILMPTYGRSTYRGQSISNAFFWAINRSQDLTLFHDWYTKTGQGMGTEYRYIAGVGSEGLMRAYWLNENAASYETIDGSTVDSPARRSYEIRSALVQQLSDAFRLSSRVEYFSDITVQQIYNNNIYESSRRTRSIVNGVSGSWQGVNLAASQVRNELFYSDVDSLISGYEPSFNLAVSSRKLGKAPLYFSMPLEAGRVLYITKNADVTEDYTLNRLDVWPALRAPLTRWDFLTLNANFRFRYTYFSESWDERGRQVEVPYGRKYADFGADLIGPVFTKVYTPQNALADRLKHVIEPVFSLQRTTDAGERYKVPRLGSSYDFVVDDATRIAYGLTNRILVRKTPTDPDASQRAGAPRELLSISIAQSYYSDKLQSSYDPQYASSYGVRAPSNFSPASLIVRAAPTALSTVDFRWEYDLNEGYLQGLSTTANVGYPTLQGNFGWSQRRRDVNVMDNAINGGVNLKSREGRYGGSYNLNWDVGRGYIIQQRWAAYINAQCCGLSLEYQTYNYPAFDPRFAVPTDRRFNFSFTLAGLGSFSNFFGTFGGGGGSY
jgi:lipopolysaccharide assembly outer membrane protein LptD (OstA)